MSVAEVSERLGVTPHGLYKWVNAVKPENSTLQATELLEAKREIPKLKSDLKRTEVERDILKQAARHFAYSAYFWCKPVRVKYLCGAIC